MFNYHAHYYIDFILLPNDCSYLCIFTNVLTTEEPAGISNRTSRYIADFRKNYTADKRSSRLTTNNSVHVRLRVYNIISGTENRVSNDFARVRRRKGTTVLGECALYAYYVKSYYRNICVTL